MWVRHILLAILAFGCGAAVSAGTFAFLLVLGVVPRLLGKTKEASRIFMAENLIILGVLTGAVLSVFEWKAAFPVAWITHVLFAGYGISAQSFLSRRMYAVAAKTIASFVPSLNTSS